MNENKMKSNITLTFTWLDMSTWMEWHSGSLSCTVPWFESQLSQKALCVEFAYSACVSSGWSSFPHNPKTGSIGELETLNCPLGVIACAWVPGHVMGRVGVRPDNLPRKNHWKKIHGPSLVICHTSQIRLKWLMNEIITDATFRYCCFPIY